MEATTARVRKESQQDRINRENVLGNVILSRRNNNGRRRHRGGSGLMNSTTSTDTMAEATEIQKSLSRTQALLGNELKRISHVASAIDDDGKMLQETRTEQQSMNVNKASKALTNLQVAQQREQRYLVASIVFFWLVVIYIFWSRVVLHMPFVDMTVIYLRKMIV